MSMIDIGQKDRLTSVEKNEALCLLHLAGYEIAGRSLTGFEIIKGQDTEGNTKYGYVNKHKQYKVISEPRYDIAMKFDGDFAIVGNRDESGENRYGCIDATGTELLRPIHGLRDAIIYLMNSQDS